MAVEHPAERFWSRLKRSRTDSLHIVQDADLQSAVEQTILETLAVLADGTNADIVAVYSFGNGVDGDSTGLLRPDYLWEWKRQTLIHPGSELMRSIKLADIPQYLMDWSEAANAAPPQAIDFNRSGPVETSDLGLHSMLAGRLCIDEKIQGFVCLLSTAATGIWTEQHRSMLRLGSTSIGNALARSNSENERSLERARYQSLAKHASDTTVIVTADGTILYHGPTSQRTVGISPEHRIGQSALEFVHQQDKQQLLETLDDLARRAHGAVSHVTVRVWNQDERWHLHDLTLTNLLDDLAIRGIVINSRNVNRQRQAEDRVRQSEQRFRSLVQHSSDVIAILGADARIQYLSPSSEEITGQANSERIGRRIFEVVHPDDLQRVRGWWAELVSDVGSTQMIRYRISNPMKGWRYVEFVGTNKLDDETIGGIVINSRDVTDRLESEQALRASEARFRTVVQSMSDVIVIVDAEGILTYASPSSERILGVSADSLIGQNALATVHPDDRPATQAALEHVVTNDDRIPAAVYRTLDGQGRWRYMEATSTNLLGEPDIEGVVISARDITHRKQIQMALAGQNQVLRKLSTGSQLADCLDELCRALESTVMNIQCTILLLDSSGKYVKHGAAPSLAREFIEAIDGSEIGPSAGSCGTAIYRGQTVITPDIELDPKWDGYREPALVEGLRSCWSVPIRDPKNETVLGAFAAYSTTVRQPTEAELEYLVESSHLASVVIQTLRADEALRNSERRFRSLVQNGSDIISVINAEGILSYVSPSISRILGYQVLEIENQSLSSYIHPDDRNRVILEFEAAIAVPGGIRLIDYRMLHTDGRWIHFETLLSNALDDPAVRGIVANSRDITDRKVLEERLSWQAFHDSLTGLPNRQMFQERLERALLRAKRRESRVGVMFLDLDRFKVINDSQGHAVGDALLIDIGNRLVEAVRTSDTVARLGGDEFTILLEDVESLAEPARIANRILDAMGAAFTLASGQEVFVDLSIGIALNTGVEDDAGALLRNADVALYHAKANGRGRVAVYDPSMSIQLPNRLNLKSDRSCAQDCQE